MTQAMTAAAPSVAAAKESATKGSSE